MAKLTNEGNGLILTSAENFKIAQALYHIITGKTEKTTKLYKSNYHITFEDIEQLYAKLTQMLTQWEILGSTCNIIISHCNDGNDEYSSFERFRLYDSSKATAVEDITFSFSFLLKQKAIGDDRCESVQNYNITVRLLNKVAFYNNRKRALNPQFIRIVTEDNMILEIEYVDYAIARNIISTIDSWESELNKNDNNKVLDFIQSISMYFPRITQVILFIITCLVLINNINSDLVDFISLARFGLFSTLIVFTFFQLGHYLGKYLENNIDGLISTAYIELNRGDKKELKRYHDNNLRRILSIASMIIGTVILGIFTEPIIKFLEDLIK